ncbi:MAG: hypothetical protein ACI4J2_03595 [Ruminococcus sp.]
MRVRELATLYYSIKYVIKQFHNELDVYGYLLYLLTILPKWGENPSDE